MRAKLRFRAQALALALAITGVLAGLAGAARAQNDPAASYPNRIIKIVVGFAAAAATTSSRASSDRSCRKVSASP